MLLFYFYSIVSLIYFALHIFFLIGYFRSSKLKQNDSSLPKVSVVVAARNEEKNILSCIESLKRLNYDLNLLEIILVNDNSTDDTKNIMIEETKNLSQFKVIESDIQNHKNLKGKPNAIDSAISISSGNIILMTDADCRVPQNWVMETIKYYHDDIQMVCGFTKIKYENSLFAKLQSLDWIYLLSLASCSSGIGKIMSCIGNNLTFTKKVYIDVGGYSKIDFSVTEDMALMRVIGKNKNYKIAFPINPDCLVSTDECKNIRELYYQKKRWFKGGFKINFLGWIMGFELYTMNIIFAMGFLFINIYLYLIIILVKVLSELIIILPIYIKLKYKSLIYYFPLFQVYFALYSLMLPFTFIFGKKIKWKDRKL